MNFLEDNAFYLSAVCTLLYVLCAVLGELLYRGAGKSLPQPGRKQATATEDFEFHMSYL